MISIDQLQSQWAKIGYRFAHKEYDEIVDIELLIINTIMMGRNEPSLIWALLTWLIQYSDIVNIHRLFRIVEKHQEPILGAISEIALTEGADKKLKYVVKKCQPSKKPYVLFFVMEETSTTDEFEKQNCLPIFRKWGIYSSTITIKKDALRQRSYILRNNTNLAIRAVFGANTRSEVLFSLTQLTHAYISQLAKYIGLSYQPVYAETEQLLLNGLLEYEQIGTMKLVSLSPRTAEFIRLLPVG